MARSNQDFEKDEEDQKSTPLDPKLSSLPNPHHQQPARNEPQPINSHLLHTRS